MQPKWIKLDELASHPTLSEASFQIAPLTRMQLWQLSDYHMTAPKGIALSAEGRQFLIKVGLRDWKGVTDSAGAALPFPAGQLEMMVELIEPVYLDALARKIYDATNLSEAARKN